MSSSVKLHIVKALDSTLRLKEGMEWFIGKCPSQHQPGSTATSSILPDSSTSIKVEEIDKNLGCYMR